MLWTREHRTGTTIKVSRVANPSPKITATAMGSPPLGRFTVDIPGQVAKIKADTGPGNNFLHIGGSITLFGKLMLNPASILGVFGTLVCLWWA
jgi:hypothetical protein